MIQDFSYDQIPKDEMQIAKVSRWPMVNNVVQSTGKRSAETHVAIRAETINRVNRD